ncbi:MAG TPA: hypothetical protein VLH60_05420, partial [Sedimentisphaerales bacterium]|nr:hypothetical protein [Sedimentisphaerales bacterium]
MAMDDCFSILLDSYNRAEAQLGESFVADKEISARIEAVALCLKNRAGVRALLAGLLAKIHKPPIDIRRPYTDIAGKAKKSCYSGRFYDERYVQKLISPPYNLPINSTTAFLTPGFRTKNIALTTDVALEGRPTEMYTALLYLFADVQANRVSASSAM